MQCVTVSETVACDGALNLMIDAPVLPVTIRKAPRSNHAAACFVNSLSSSLSSAAFGTIYLGISPNDAPAKISFVQITSLKFRSATVEIIGD